jgi:hypothetical protein
MSVEGQELVIVARDLRGKSAIVSKWSLASLTSFGSADFSHGLRGAFDKDVAALLAKLSNDHTGSPQLRDELK